MAGVSSAPAQNQAAVSPSAAEVVKLSRAGMGDEVIRAYIKSCQSPFTLSADGILQLKDAGVTSPLIAAMLAHDTSLRGQNPPAAFNYNQRLYPPAEQTPGAPAPAQPAPQQQFVAPAPGPAPAGQTPPPVPTEVIPVSPGPDYYWAPGYWGWDNGWIWVGGGWRFGVGLGWGGWGWGWGGPRYGWGWGWGGHGGWGGYHGGGWGGHGGFGHGGGHGR